MIICQAGKQAGAALGCFQPSNTRTLALQVTLWPSASSRETRNKVRTPTVRYIQTARGPGGAAQRPCGPPTAHSCVTAARVPSRGPALRVWVSTPEGTALHERLIKGFPLQRLRLIRMTSGRLCRSRADPGSGRPPPLRD